MDCCQHRHPDMYLPFLHRKPKWDNYNPKEGSFLSYPLLLLFTLVVCYVGSVSFSVFTISSELSAASSAALIWACNLCSNEFASRNSESVRNSIIILVRLIYEICIKPNLFRNRLSFGWLLHQQHIISLRSSIYTNYTVVNCWASQNTRVLVNVAALLEAKDKDNLLNE